MEPFELFGRDREPSWGKRTARHFAALLGWVGPRRIIAAAAIAVAAIVGGWWLLHAPAPAVERRLPFAGQGSGVGAATTAPGAAVGTSGPSAGPPVDPAAQATGAAAQPAVLVVHVAGAVVRPGLVRLAPGSRVDDALRAAGGALPEADVDALNLAAFVVDGARVYVPQVGEVVSGSPDVSGSTGPALRMDINTASAEQFDSLPGVGPSLARAIAQYRDVHGPFRHVDDLLQVPGIGPSKLQQFRALVMV